MLCHVRCVREFRGRARRKDDCLPWTTRVCRLGRLVARAPSASWESRWVMFKCIVWMRERSTASSHISRLDLGRTTFQMFQICHSRHRRSQLMAGKLLSQKQLSGM